MKEVARSNDPVFLSWAQAVLRDAGIEPFVFDTHMSVLDGSVGILPRRIMVADDHASEAIKTLQEAAPPEPTPPEPTHSCEGDSEDRDA